MAQDPYSVLGVGRSATADEIRKAYRTLAKKLHPDYNPGDKAAEERFKNVSAAFDILGDADKKAKFDRGEMDADGNEKAYMRSGGFSRNAGPRGARPGDGGARGPQGYDDISSIFGDLFGSRGGGGRAQPMPQKGRDLRYRLSVDFMDAARGGSKRVGLSDGRSLDVGIPEGVRDGQTLRLKGKGEPGVAGGAAGDVLVDITVRPHPVFDIDGDNLTLDIPVSLKEAVLGAKIEIPTLKGVVAIKIPPNTSSGRVFRLRGKGLKNPKNAKFGDMLARIRIVLPEEPDEALSAFVEEWEDDQTDPRQALKEASA